MKRTGHVSETPATQFLRRHRVPFTEHVYDYVEHGGTAESLPRICINGGRRGYLVGIAPRVLVDLLGARPVSCAL